MPAVQTTTFRPSRRHADVKVLGRSLRVLIAGKLHAMTSPGGGETQMLATAAALRRQGVDARMWRPWEDDLANFDCLHLFGSEREHLPLVDAAHRCGVPSVLSTIAWFDLPSLWHETKPWPLRAARCGKFLLRAALPSIPSWRRRLYRSVDLLLPNSQAEAEQLVRFFNVPKRRIHVSPNGADQRFAAATPEAFAKRFGVSNFVLYAGRIEPRKNQLGFLRAMRGAGLPIVILGDVVPGYEGYLDRCRRIAGPDVRFVARIDHDDPLLASAYAACRCLALTSWFETPGLVALEAGMQGIPLVLTTRGCAGEYFGPLAQYVEPGDTKGIRKAVQAAMQAGRSSELAELVLHNYSWQAAAESTTAAYVKVCR